MNYQEKSRTYTVPEALDMAVHMAFFMDGMLVHSAKLSGCREQMDLGNIEMVTELATYVFTLIDLEVKAAKVFDGNYPGVIDYEVSEEFGKWFATETLKNTSLPTHEEAYQYLVKAVYDFFAQGPAVTDQEKVLLRRALGISTGDTPRTLVLEAYATGSGEVPSPAYLSLMVDDWLIGELHRLLQAVDNNGLTTATVGIDTLGIFKWDESPSNITCNELVVDQDGTFYITGLLGFGDYSVETRALDITDIENALAGEFPEVNNPFKVSNGRLYYSTGGNLEDLVSMVEDRS